ncbi:MAG: hypothetical protein M9962_09480 [Oligoflexia bacterium]|nr:hypothetical protein [Oligoflexia bacterium]
MAELSKNQVIVLMPIAAPIQEMLKVLEEKPNVEITNVNSMDEATQLIAHHQPCMLISGVNENKDIPQLISLVKKIENFIKQGVVKTLVYSKIKNPQLSMLVSKLGITDYLEDPIPARTIQFKANLQIKAIETIKKQLEQKRLAEEKIVFKKDTSKSGNSDNQDNSNGIESNKKPALSLEKDTFLFKNSTVKKHGKKYKIELEGPAPESGEWKPNDDKGEKANSWRWVPKDEKDKKSSDSSEDGWVHDGEKPNFNEHTGKWQFQSEKPKLSYKENKKELASKIETSENGEISIAEDSPQAEENVDKSFKSSGRTRKSDKEKIEENPEASAAGDENEKNNTLKKNLTKKTPDEEAAFNNKLKDDNKDSIEFNNKTGGLKDTANPFTSKIQPNEKNAKNEEDFTTKKEKNISSIKKSFEDDKVESKEKPTLNPLEYLKKKKEEKKFEQKEKNTTNEKDKNKKEKEGASLKNKKKNLLGSKLDSLKNALNKSNSLGKSEYSDTNESEIIEEDIAEGVDTKESIEKDNVRSINDAKKKRNKEEKIHNQKERKVRSTAEKKNLLDKKKKDLLDKLQSIEEDVEENIEEINEEQIDKLKKDLDIPLTEDISPKELKKRAKKSKIDSLKEKLQQLEAYSERLEDTENKSDFNEHDLSEEDPENTWSQKNEHNSSAKEIKRNAYDSDENVESEEEEEKLGSLKKQTEKNKQKNESDYFYKPQSEINPIEGAWEAVEKYYIYIGGEHRYKGFKAIKDILPIWVYEGLSTPELKSKTKEWEFRGGKLNQINSEKDLPLDVKDYLLNLQKLFKEAESLPTKSENTQKKKEAKKSLDNLKDILKEQKIASEIIDNEKSDSENEINEDHIEESSELNKTKDKKISKDLADKYKNLQNSLDAELEKIQIDEITETSAEEIESDSSVQDERENRTKEEIKLSETSSEIEPPEEIKKQGKLNSNEIEKELEALEKEKAEKKSQQEKDAIAAKISSLAKALEEEREQLLEVASEEQEPPIGPATDFKKQKKYQEFLERRKKKKDSQEKQEKAANIRQQEKLEPKGPSYGIGLFVVLSDAVSMAQYREKAMTKILTCLRDALAPATVGFLKESTETQDFEVFYNTPGGLQKGEIVNTVGAIVIPVIDTQSIDKKNLGYLYLRGVPESIRIDSEETIMKQIISSIETILTSQEIERSNVA